MTPQDLSPKGFTRRSFMKTSAFTVGGVALLSTGSALATTTGGGPFEIKGELCSKPTEIDIEDLIGEQFVVTIPGLEVGSKALFLKLIHRCTKLDDPNGTMPYPSCTFSHMAWAEVWSAGGTKIAESPMLLWEFAATYDYENAVVNIGGGIVSPSTTRKSASVWIKDPTKSGGSYCHVEIWQTDPASEDGNGTAQASVSTWVQGKFRMTGETQEGTPIYEHPIPVGTDELKSTFVAA